MSEQILEFVKQVSEDRVKVMEDLQGVHVEILKMIDEVFRDVIKMGIEEIIHSNYLGDDEVDG